MFYRIEISVSTPYTNQLVLSVIGHDLNPDELKVIMICEGVPSKLCDLGDHIASVSAFLTCYFSSTKAIDLRSAKECYTYCTSMH